MAKRVQLIRHTTGGANAFAGLEGEITVDTTAKELRVHDGLTAGGIPVARKDLANVAVATAAIAGKMTALQVVELTAATANVAQEVIDRIADVDAEEARALAAEGVIQADVDANETASDAADVILQGNIDAEEAARIAADTVLDGLIALKGDIDGQTFTNATLTSPVITSSVAAAQVSYAKVTPDGPVNLLTTTTAAGVWTPLDMSVIYAQAATDGAILANLRASLLINPVAVGDVVVLSIREVGSSISFTQGRIGILRAHATTPAAEIMCVGSVVLDANSDFEYYALAVIGGGSLLQVKIELESYEI